ncbi:DUF4270 family protein [Chryseolinea soli]|uniref:DUF4270 family protein n=2 Tax=Chryseolinea soli TaxID=2321403 RepID=A0A385SLR2_9BACT|nr:DUF4270 family protein [Chryseolinea soli]
MNLWVNRIGQLTILAVALFFLACQEDVSLLGYQNPNSKLKVSYVEIPIGSSVLLMDSIRTSNYTYSGETNRLLVGTYKDEVFGNITASAFSQYLPATGDTLRGSAVFDSVTLRLKYDFYTYGTPDGSGQALSVYELDNPLDPKAYYVNHSDIPASALLGTKNYGVNSTDFKKFVTDGKDTIITLNVPLESSFGQRIFNSALEYRLQYIDAKATGKTAEEIAELMFINPAKFTAQYKGIAIKPTSGDKIVGFDPSSTESRIILHYHDAKDDSLTLSLPLTTVYGFNQIKTDRSGSALGEMNDFYKDYLVDGDNRYVQSGTGVVTKLDFSKFYDFADTLKNSVIHSAELVVDNVQSSTTNGPPAGLSLRMLLDNNHLNKYNAKNNQDQYDLVYFTNLRIQAAFLRYDFASSGSGAVPIIENDSAFFAAGDRIAYLPYSGTTTSYRGDWTLFFQKLSEKDDQKTRFKYFALYPTGTKTLNRAVFPKNSIKLKVFYTKSTAVAN